MCTPHVSQEGGIRVPAFWQWKGVIPANSTVTHWGANTDLLPTFLDAANIPKPSSVLLDGVSLLPVLKEKRGGAAGTGHGSLLGLTKEHKLRHKEHKNATMKFVNSPLHSRVYLWHKDTDPFRNDNRIQGAAYFEELKIITSSSAGCLDRVFDMKHDPLENRNLAVNAHSCKVSYDRMSLSAIEDLIDRSSAKSHCEGSMSSLTGMVKVWVAPVALSCFFICRISYTSYVALYASTLSYWIMCISYCLTV